MEVIVIESTAYHRLLAEIRALVAQAVSDVKQETKQATDDDLWIERKEAEKILKCKYDKLKRLIDEDKIKQQKDGRKILIYKPSIFEYLAKGNTR